MRFTLLGPVEVLSDDRPLMLAGVRQRAILAALLLRPNEVMAVDHVVRMVWEEPPRSAVANLRTHVAALRRLVGARLVTQAGGYRFTVGPGELDLLRFRALRDAGENAHAEGRSADAVRDLGLALELWRGEALENISHGTGLQSSATGLDEERLTAIERHAEARLSLGDVHGLAGVLQCLVRAHPLRERLWAHLMVALYRSGRQADALAAYADVRRTMAEELGIEPGPELRDLSERILRADPVLTSTAVVARLPPVVPDLVGRSADVEVLRSGLLDRAGVWTITGAAGAGKTTLAVHVADLVRDAYPDGRLHLDLRTMGTMEALGKLLQALDVPGARIPDGVDERAARYRASLAGRKVLVVLDNASDEAQVRPLLPGSGTSAALVTSRAALAGLDATVVVLGVLSPTEGVELLRSVVGTTRVDAEPVAAQAIATHCGHLPLALRIAAARLVARPHWLLEHLVARLSDEHLRLAELCLGDLDVRASLALSHDELDHRHQRAFRLLSLLDVAEFPAWVVGPLLGAGEDVVEELVDTRLVEFAYRDALGHNRFRLGVLPRAFGRDLPAGEDDVAALTRLFDAWLELAEQAGRRIPRRSLCFAGGADGWNSGDPVAWFDAEWPNLVALIDQARTLGLSTHAWRLAVASAAYCDLRSHYDDWDHIHRVAAACATDPRAVAVVRQQTGVLRCGQNRFADAAEEFTAARDLFAEVGDVDGAAYARYGLGLTHERHSRPTEALEDYLRAVEGFTESDNQHALLEVLSAVARQASDGDETVEHPDGEITPITRPAVPGDPDLIPCAVV